MEKRREKSGGAECTGGRGRQKRRRGGGQKPPAPACTFGNSPFALPFSVCAETSQGCLGPATTSLPSSSPFPVLLRCSRSVLLQSHRLHGHSAEARKGEGAAASYSSEDWRSESQRYASKCAPSPAGIPLLYRSTGVPYYECDRTHVGDVLGSLPPLYVRTSAPYRDLRPPAKKRRSLGGRSPEASRPGRSSGAIAGLPFRSSLVLAY